MAYIEIVDFNVILNKDMLTEVSVLKVKTFSIYL